MDMIHLSSCARNHGRSWGRVRAKLPREVLGGKQHMHGYNHMRRSGHNSV